MKFPRFLAFGSSLTGLDSKPKTYRVVASGLPRLAESRPQELTIAAQPIQAPEAPKRPASPFVPAKVSSGRREGFFRRLGSRLARWVGAWIPAGKPSRRAVQTELRLDAVRPLRSPLVDDDVKVVMGTKAPAEPKVTLVATSPAVLDAMVPPTPEPFERAVHQRRWNRPSGWFRAAEKVGSE